MVARVFVLLVSVCLTVPALASPAVPAWRHVPADDHTSSLVVAPQDVFVQDGQELEPLDDESRLADDIVRVWSRFPDGSSIRCSGATVGAATVLTAGHCLHNVARGGWADSVLVGVVKGGGSGPIALTEARAFVALHSWVELEDPRFDVGLLELEEPIGCEVGWLEPVVASDALFELPVVLTGFGVDVAGDGELEQEGHVASVGRHHINHDFRLTQGLGGAGIRLAGTDLLVAIQGSVLSPTASRVSPQLVALVEQVNRRVETRDCNREGSGGPASKDQGRPAPIEQRPLVQSVATAQPVRFVPGCSAPGGGTSAGILFGLVGLLFWRRMSTWRREQTVARRVGP